MNFIKIGCVATLMLPAIASATLGGTPGSSALALPSSHVVSSAGSSAAPYSVHESRTPEGVTIREYTSTSNVVFAVTWQGPLRPDMHALLGSYFPNFVAAGQRIARGTGPLIERNGELQIESTGRPGEFAGKAYVPRLVPTSVDVGQLQ